MDNDEVLRIAMSMAKNLEECVGAAKEVLKTNPQDQASWNRVRRLEKALVAWTTFASYNHDYLLDASTGYIMDDDFQWRR